MSDIPMVEVIVRVKQSYYYRNNLFTGNVLCFLKFTFIAVNERSSF